MNGRNRNHLGFDVTPYHHSLLIYISVGLISAMESDKTYAPFTYTNPIDLTLFTNIKDTPWVSAPISLGLCVFPHIFAVYACKLT